MTSLRQLARLLQVSHSSLSKSFRAGTLSQGLRLDAAGRLVVDDAAAAIAEWRACHVPRLRMPSVRETPPPPPAPDPLDVEVHDQHYDRWTTPREVLAERDELALLCSALVAAALDSAEAGAIRTMVAGSLHAVAPLHDAGESTIAGAEREIASVLEMIRLTEHDDDDDDAE